MVNKKMNPKRVSGKRNSDNQIHLREKDKAKWVKRSMNGFGKPHYALSNMIRYAVNHMDDGAGVSLKDADSLIKCISDNRMVLATFEADFRRIIEEVNRLGNNVNQIAKKINLLMLKAEENGTEFNEQCRELIGFRNDTLENNHRLLVACMGYEPKCGDIVIVSHGANLPDPIVKRVIATAGQTLEIDSSTGDVIVDGVLLKEDYVKGITMVRSGFDGIRIPKVIPEGYIFVMGDNRENSKDSRSADVGLVPVENVIGKAYARWFPFNKIGNI